MTVVVSNIAVQPPSRSSSRSSSEGATFQTERGWIALEQPLSGWQMSFLAMPRPESLATLVLDDQVFDDDAIDNSSYTCIDVNGDEVDVLVACPSGPWPRIEGAPSFPNGPEITAGDSWVLLDTWDGNDPVSRTPSTVSTVVSRLLTDASSVAPLSALGNMSPNNALTILTWAHTCDHVVSSPLSQPSARDIILALPTSHRGVDLLRALSYCELQLLELENGAHNGCGAAHEVERGAACSKLCSELVCLAAEALECGFSRDVRGAMGVFEQANVAVERVAGLLQRDATTSVCAGAPLWAKASSANHPSRAGCGCLVGISAALKELSRTIMASEQCK